MDPAALGYPGTSVSAIGGLETSTLGTEPVAVLLVEDDEGDALLVRELLHGVDVRWARSLADAASDAGVVDCVLLDLALPDAERLEALDWVLGSRPNAAIVVLTGDADERRGVDAVGAGAQDFLVKGQIDADVLSRSIRYAVARKRADLAARELYEAQARAEREPALRARARAAPAAGRRAARLGQLLPRRRPPARAGRRLLRRSCRTARAACSR